MSHHSRRYESHPQVVFAEGYDDSVRRSSYDPAYYQHSPLFAQQTGSSHTSISSQESKHPQYYNGGSVSGHSRLVKPRHPTGSGGSITLTRQKLHAAQAAEKEALAVLNATRRAVKEAYEQVRALEEEANEDVRMAKAKRSEAKDLRRSARSLGRV